jgi:hypothetical protein
LSVHLTKDQIEGYSRRALSPIELLSVSEHLVLCGVCRQQVQRALDGDAAYLALRSELFREAEIFPSFAGRAHLTFEQIAGLLDATLIGDELQVVKDHLTYCPQCELAVDDLRTFKDQVAFDSEDRLSPMNATTEKGWQRAIATLASLWPKPLVLGASLAALLLAAASWLVWQELLIKETDIVVTTTSPNVSMPISQGSNQEGIVATVITRLNDGDSQVTLDKEGKLLGVDHLPPAYRQMVKNALTGQELERSPLLAGLIEPGSMPRGGFPSGGRDWGFPSGGRVWGSDGSRDKFSVIGPVRMVTLSDRPTFRWSQLDGATAYVVEIYDEEFDLVATSPQITDNRWRAPQSLKRGRTYAWQVKAVKDGQELFTPQPPAPQAKFRILDEARAKELARARRAFASSHLTMGLLYAQAGLLDEAEREFRELQRANPDSAVAGRLLKRVQAQK